MTTTKSLANVASRRRVPPLENGDRLSRAEFERRWEAMPRLKRAELIDGIVYMAAAVRAREHGEPHAHLLAWLGQYVAMTPGVGFAADSSLRFDDDNMPQPDALLRLPERAGGRSRLTDDGYLEGPPELVAEVAASSASLDMHAKLEVYRAHGVPEYLVWRVLEEGFDWFVLRDGRYEPHTPDAAGLFKSVTFPGLWLDAAALIRGDLARVLAVVQEGARGEAHAAFAARVGPGDG